MYISFTEITEINYFKTVAGLHAKFKLFPLHQVNTTVQCCLLYSPITPILWPSRQLEMCLPMR